MVGFLFFIVINSSVSQINFPSLNLSVSQRNFPSLKLSLIKFTRFEQSSVDSEGMGVENKNGTELASH